MINSISIPVWLLAICVGLPTLTLMTLIVSLLRNKRRRTRKEAMSAIQNSGQTGFALYNKENIRQSEKVRLNDDVHQMILDLQIDTVFQSLAAIIETEKVKLKALVGAGTPLPTTLPVTGFEDSHLELMRDQQEKQPPKSEGIKNQQTEFDVAEQIAEMAADGVTPKVIAKRLGMSLSEVVLAIRMKQNTVEDDNVGYGLKAIA